MIYLVLTVAGYGALCVWVRVRETRMIFYPSRSWAATPAAVGLGYRDVELVARDGVRLHGWWVPAKAGAGAVTVLFLHGNAGNISHRLEKLVMLHELGANVLLLDYRGYGRSEGEPSEEGTYRDGEAALAWLLAGQMEGRVGTDGPVAPGRVLPQSGQDSVDGAAEVVVFGESLGTGVAVELAVRHRVRGVILEAPFTSIADVGQRLFPYLPVRWLARTRYENLAKIGQVRAPVLILHSREDEMFGLEHAERLFAAAAEPKRLVVLAGGHNDAFWVSAEVYRAAVREFLGAPQVL